jgi:iron(III) transport system substrate-binding protein
MKKVIPIALGILALLAIGYALSLSQIFYVPVREDRPPVVLYTSADDEFARLVVEEFTKESGIEVRLVGDTEATKTTGLVARLKAEADNPQADVWWSSEPFGTIDLANNNILASDTTDYWVPEDWPSGLIADDGTWAGFATRARVIVYATDRVESPPTTLRDMAQPQWKGRIGMARPEFGTTRGHMGILASRWGLPEFERWLTMLKANNIRLYDGNATIVRAVAMGEIDVGLTDTDDVWSGQRNGWAVDCVYESFDPPMITSTMQSFGPTLLPNTVALTHIDGGNINGIRLAQFLISPRVERLLAESTSRNIPVNPVLSELAKAVAPPSLVQGDPNMVQNQPIYPDFSDANEMIPAALEACERILTR